MAEYVEVDGGIADIAARKSLPPIGAPIGAGICGCVAAGIVGIALYVDAGIPFVIVLKSLGLALIGAPISGIIGAPIGAGIALLAIIEPLGIA